MDKNDSNGCLDCILRRLDALHAQDPRQIEVDGRTVPLELMHAERMSAWLWRLTETPNPLVQIAVRAQHLQRWQLPRSDYPTGRAGYLSWRTEQGRRAAERTSRIMRECGYSEDNVSRTAKMIRKIGLGRDPGAQLVEDCACLVFLENYFADFSKQVSHAQLIDILRKTWRKMSTDAHQLALELPMSTEMRAAVEEALAGT